MHSGHTVTSLSKMYVCGQEQTGHKCLVELLSPSGHVDNGKTTKIDGLHTNKAQLLVALLAMKKAHPGPHEMLSSSLDNSGTFISPSALQPALFACLIWLIYTNLIIIKCTGHEYLFLILQNSISLDRTHDAWKLALSFTHIGWDARLFISFFSCLKGEYLQYYFRMSFPIGYIGLYILIEFYFVIYYLGHLGAQFPYTLSTIKKVKKKERKKEK